MLRKISRWLHVLIIMVLLSGCGVFGGGQTITIGAKSFTEQHLLSEITFLLLEDNGYQVRQMSNLGSNVVRTALENGQVDLSWEYTGTALVNYLGEEPIVDPDEAYEKVKEIDVGYGLKWINLSEINNTYCLIMSRERAEELGIETISDLAALVNEGETLEMGTDGEFMNRSDGLPGVEESYGFSFGTANITQMDAGLIYEAIYNEQLDVGVGYETEARIENFDQVILEDDQNFFPPYNAAISLNQQTLENFPELEELTAPIAENLDSEKIRQLNYEVDVEGRSVSIVAYEWLIEHGLIEE